MSKDRIIAREYRIIRTLGKGSYGTVYLVNEVNNQRIRWALKEMVETSIPEDEREHAIDLFRREAAVLSRLNHPGIPTVKNFFSICQRHYLVMEFIDGDNLEAVKEEAVKESENGILEYNMILDWAIQLGLIINLLHRAEPDPIIFRDLKPLNIMLTYSEKRIMLVDFGICRYFSPVKLKDTQFLGTLGFSPPEQYGRGQSDQRSDIYSYGATLYYLLTNVDMEGHAFKFPPIHTLNKGVPLYFEKIIMKCLSMNPGERFQSMDEILELLKKSAPDLYNRRLSQNQETKKTGLLLDMSKFYFTRNPDQYKSASSSLKNVVETGSFTSPEISGLILECTMVQKAVKTCSFFDYSFFDDEKIISYQKQTVAMVELEGANFPKFLMRNESLLDFYFFVDDPDIDFNDNPAFSKSFFLIGPNRKAVENFFRPTLIDTFGQDADHNFKRLTFFTFPGTPWIVEAEGRHIIFYLPGDIVSSNATKQFVEHAKQVLLPFIRHAQSLM
ncbi:MAG: serine/threonine protein kinase [Vulcanimicrobiota bacterium]